MKTEFCEDYEILKDQVTDKPYDKQVPHCPSNCDAYQNRGGCTTTLVGFTGPVDPNHKWTSCICSKCYAEYTFEEQGLNSWLTIDHRLFDGIPSCFESYIYNCKCGGNITREGSVCKYEYKDDKTIRHFPRTFKCDKCGWSKYLTD